jgi:hypothetical protein
MKINVAAHSFIAAWTMPVPGLRYLAKWLSKAAFCPMRRIASFDRQALNDY